MEARSEKRPARKGVWRAGSLSEMMPAGREARTEERAKEERRVEVRDWICECGTLILSCKMNGIVGTMMPYRLWWFSCGLEDYGCNVT